MIGEYILETKKTDMSPYKSQIEQYKYLKLTFFENETFQFNMKVPFIVDSIGKWEPADGNLGAWNEMYFKNFKYIGSSASKCCLSDSTIYLNATSPKKRHAFIQEIYFRKISSKTPPISL